MTKNLYDVTEPWVNLRTEAEFNKLEVRNFQLRTKLNNLCKTFARIMHQATCRGLTRIGLENAMKEIRAILRSGDYH